MARITNGRVVAEVSDEKAQHYCNMTGFRIMQEETPAKEEVTTQTPRRRGRPKKVADAE